MTNEYLSHHGILGQKWGVRRFQNKDGSYTAAGRKRYGADNPKGPTGKQISNRLNDLDQAIAINTRRWKEADNARNFYLDKIESRVAKGKPISEKTIKKLNKAENDHAKAIDNMLKGQDEINKILSSIDNTKFDVTQTTISRNVLVGKEKIALYATAGVTGTALAALTGVNPITLGAVTGASIGSTMARYREEGTRYKVKERK